MVGVPKYGRTMRVYLQVGPPPGIPLVLWQDGLPVGPKLSLACEFVIRSMCGPYPQECELTVHGLSRAVRESLVKAYEAAEEMALKTRRVLSFGRLRVDAGYGVDAATIFIGDIAPDGIQVQYTRPGHTVKLKALDGRIQWKGRFVNKSTAINVDLQTVRSVFALGGDYMAGVDADRSFAQNFPNLVKKKLGFPGYESGYAIFGESRAHNMQICKDLGITPFFRDGEIIYIPSDSAALDLALVLTAVGNGALLDAQTLGRGRFRVRTLMEHRMRPGRQVILSDDLGRPIGSSGGLFRCDAMVAEGGNRSQNFNIEADLTPTGLTL
jgi:hypothetical protein